MADLPQIDQEWMNQHMGIVCDQCGHNRFIAEQPWQVTVVTHTRPRNDMVMRRRVCRNCGWVMWTEERKVT